MLSDSFGDYWITPDELLVSEAISRVENPKYGAVSFFGGAVRTPSHGREIVGIYYESYTEMVIERFAQVAREGCERFGAGRICIAHRVGRVPLGGLSLVVAVGSVHRKEGLAACSFSVDRIKELAPIWKKEIFEGGEQWVGFEGKTGKESHPSEGMKSADAHEERKGRVRVP